VVGTAGHYIDLTATFVETRQVASMRLCLTCSRPAP